MDQSNSTPPETTSPFITPLPQVVAEGKYYALRSIFEVLLFIVTLVALSYFFFILPKQKSSTEAATQKGVQPLQVTEQASLPLLATTTSEISTEENAYVTLQKIHDVFVYNPETKVIGTTLFKMGNGETWDDNLAKTYLGVNQNALTLLSEFSAKKVYTHPAYQTITKETVASTTTDLTFIKNLLTISNVQFENALRRKDIKSAETIFFERLNIANLLLGSNEESASIVRASTNRNHVLTNLLPRLLSYDKIAASTSRSFEGRILDSPVPSSTYTAFLETEASLFNALNSSSIDELAAGQKDTRVVQALQMAADTSLSDFKKISKVYRDEMNKPCTEMNSETVIKSIETVRAKTGPNKDAESFFDDKVRELFDEYLFSFNRKCLDKISTGSALLLIGLKSYSDDNGALPETLDALVPRFLTSLPLDPYSGKPFIYNKEKGYIYSLGEDKKDDGGSTEKVYWSKMNDPTFWIVR